MFIQRLDHRGNRGWAQQHRTGGLGGGGRNLKGVREGFLEKAWLKHIQRMSKLARQMGDDSKSVLSGQNRVRSHQCLECQGKEFIYTQRPQELGGLGRSLWVLCEVCARRGEVGGGAKRGCGHSLIREAKASAGRGWGGDGGSGRLGGWGKVDDLRSLPACGQ